MPKEHDSHARLRGFCRTMIVVATSGLLLARCMHDAPPMLTERTAVISGKATAGHSANDATEIVLFKAAAMTLDHGFRYFQITGSDSVVADRSGNEMIRPGANVTIRVYREGEINPRTSGIVDAEYIAQNDRREAARLEAPAPDSRMAPAVPPQATPPPTSAMPTPHCTVYGCTW